MAEDRNGDKNENSDYCSEDEGTKDYRPGGYHAVRIGDTFNNGCYVVQTKLGWGYFSTVWLAWDVQRSRYVALKIQKSVQHYTEAAMVEIKILRQIAEGDPDDKKCVVKLLDHFKHSGPNGQHVCMVFEFLGDNLLTLIKYRGVPLPMVKEICYHILVGLDYLHQELSIIHRDLKPANVLLLSMIDPSKDHRESGAPLILPSTEGNFVSKNEVTKDHASSNGNLIKNPKKKVHRTAKVENEIIEEAEVSKAHDQEDSSDDLKSNVESVEDKPSSSVSKDEPTKTVETKDVPQGSQGQRKGSGSMRKKLLAAVDPKCKLVDFGIACWTDKHTNVRQSGQYRCPEVILGSKHSTAADLWSFACTCFELATGDVLFDPHGDNYDEDHLALMMELLGMMPRKIALGFRNSRKFFDRYGDLRLFRRLRISPLDKVLMEKYNFSEQEAKDMTNFLVPILDFDPEKRPTAAQCLSHPWISAGPRILQSSTTRVQREAIEGGMSEETKRDKAQQEAVEVGAGNIAIDGTPKRLKKSQSVE